MKLLAETQSEQQLSLLRKSLDSGERDRIESAINGVKRFLSNDSLSFERREMISEQMKDAINFLNGRGANRKHHKKIPTEKKEEIKVEVLQPEADAVLPVTPSKSQQRRDQLGRRRRRRRRRRSRRGEEVDRGTR